MVSNIQSPGEPYRVTLNDPNAYKTWQDIQWDIVAPAIAEANTILKMKTDDKNPGWGGSNTIHQNKSCRDKEYDQTRRDTKVHHIYIHDYRRPFSVWDTWGYWSPRIVHHHHYYHTASHVRTTRPHDPNARDEVQQQAETAMKVLRFAVGVICIVGIYYTGKSLDYATRQGWSAFSKLRTINTIATEDKLATLKQSINDESIKESLGSVIELRKKLLEQSLKKNGCDALFYITEMASMTLVGLGALFASYGLGVTGCILGTAALVSYAFARCIMIATIDAKQEKQAEDMLNAANSLKNTKFVYQEVLPDSDLPTYEEATGLYPDIDQIQEDLNKIYSNEQKWAPSAPEIHE